MFVFPLDQFLFSSWPVFLFPLTTVPFPPLPNLRLSPRLPRCFFSLFCYPITLLFLLLHLLFTCHYPYLYPVLGDTFSSLPFHLSLLSFFSPLMNSVSSPLPHFRPLLIHPLNDVCSLLFLPLIPLFLPSIKYVAFPFTSYFPFFSCSLVVPPLSPVTRLSFPSYLTKLYSLTLSFIPLFPLSVDQVWPLSSFIPCFPHSPRP